MLVSVLGEGRGQDKDSYVGECFGGGKGTGRGQRCWCVFVGMEGDRTRAAMLVIVCREERGQDEGSNVGECLWGGKGTGRGQRCW